MINHNILGKIMDKIVLEKWKNRVENINQEYHNIFILDNTDSLRSYFPHCGKCCNFDLRSSAAAYNYRFSELEYSIHIHCQYFVKCNKCDKSDNVIIRQKRSDNVIIRYKRLDILCYQY